MAIRVIDDTKLQNIAVAIQAKDNGGRMTVDEMPGRIALLPAAPVENPALVLWDWEGTKLAEYSAEDALALTELPAPSTLPAYADVDHELLLFQKWNWSLTNIKTWIQNHEGETLDVGAIYTTTDGQDHNYWGNPRLDTATTIIMQKRGTVGIGDGAFSNYSLTRINIPDSVTSIGTYVFSGCFSLPRINIPDSVTSIGDGAFKGCYSLTRINIPDSVTIIGDVAFSNCFSLPRINIPDSVTSIGTYVFNNCYSLTRINIPDSVTIIGDGAFSSCFSLTRINIPDSVTSIENYAFINCYSLCDIFNESKSTLSNVNAFAYMPSIYRVYVPRANLSWHETETNWATIYTQGHIVAIEDYIEYLESLGFDVDKYKEVTV